MSRCELFSALFAVGALAACAQAPIALKAMDRNGDLVAGVIQAWLESLA